MHLIHAKLEIGQKYKQSCDYLVFTLTEILFNEPDSIDRTIFEFECLELLPSSQTVYANQIWNVLSPIRKVFRFSGVYFYPNLG